MCVSVEMQVDVYGIPELKLKVDRLDQTIRDHVDQALQFEVQAMQTHAQILAPKRTGYLASTVFAERVKEWAFRLGARAHYAVFVEYGTRLMLPRRFLSRALELGMSGLVQHVSRAVHEAVREASS